MNSDAIKNFINFMGSRSNGQSDFKQHHAALFELGA